MEQVLTEAQAVVLERHLDPARPRDLALWSLRGLAVLDSRLTAELRQGELRLAAEDRHLASRPVPPDLDMTTPDRAAVGVASLLGALYHAAWEYSPRIRRAGADRLLSSGFEELFNHLDPYSRYVSPQEARAARERRVGQSGLGLRIAAQGEALVIAAVSRDGPAAEAGIRRGDRLLAIDGRPVSGNDPGRAAALLEGPEGSEVTLTLAQGSRRRTVRLTRLVVPPETLEVQRQDDILWLRLSGFSAATDQSLAIALSDSFASRPPRGVVLDLRGNRGGLLSQAVAVADAFLEGGEVARTEGRHPDAARRYIAAGRDLALGRPVVVLVDGRTASAAEIVAAALAERWRAVVVGSATQGKGLIQLVAPLSNKGELLVTWSRVLAPTGWPIQGLGVLPAVCTSLGPQALARSMVQLHAGEAPMARALARHRAARAPVLASEIAALRDSCPPAEGRAVDVQLARQLIDNPLAYRAALAAP